jgi:Ca-activated chloride channel homolog
MGTPFELVVHAEHKNVESGASTLWAAIRVDPKGKALEAERAPLAVVLVIDTSSSMQGAAIEHVLRSCEIVSELLDARDQLAIVTFSNHSGVRCGLTTTDDTGRQAIRVALRDVVASGSTNMHAGIETGVGLLVTAPAGLRRVMVVLSDGQPNIGISTGSELAAYVRGLRLAVSTLGFGPHHSDEVLDAIATAGSGRYAYIPDPRLARVELARAALAHGGVIADQLELRIKPGEGVELTKLLPASPLRVTGAGVITELGDVFVDEGRLVALELVLDLAPSSRGRLAEITVEGRLPNGTKHKASAELIVDVRAGARVVDRDAQRDVLLIAADEARTEARAQADRRAFPSAAQLLRAMAARIDASEGFVRNDGTPLAELREQLEDEAANYEKRGTDSEMQHKMKASRMYKQGTPAATPMAQRIAAPIHAQLVGLSGAIVGQKYTLMLENVIGRGAMNDIPVNSGMLSRKHTRILFLDDHFVLQDLGSTNGSQINDAHVGTAPLADGDVVKLGDAVFRFEIISKP